MIISDLPVNKNPKSFGINITSKCNMHCSWCVAAKQREHTELDIPWTEETMRKLWERYTLEEDNIRVVSISGGEPLLEYPRIFEIVNCIRERDARKERETPIVIHTNGSLLTDEMCEFFNSQRVGINVSMGATGEKGLYNLANKAAVHGRVFDLINSLTDFTVRYVALKRTAYAEDVFMLRNIFPRAVHISIAPDQTVFDRWTEEDVRHEIEQLNRLVKLDPDFHLWGEYVNTVSGRGWETEYICFRGSGDVTARYTPGLVTYETNELFGLAPELAAQLTEGVTQILFPSTEKKNAPLIPLNLQILTNLNCNLACTYCYECKGRGQNDAETIKQFIAARYEEADMRDSDREVILEFIGGESLLYPKMLDELCEYTATLHKERNCTGPLTVSLSSNGTLIAEDADVQKFLLKWRPYVGFSIDGTKEIHDACRIDAEGRGSYDRAVAGWNWAKEHLCPKRTGVKATYTHETIRQYAAGLINLIQLGFTDIAANVVFEEQWTLEDAPTIAEQMFRVVDYLFDNGLEDKVHVFQINNSQMDMRHYKAETGPKEQNHCGTCTHMRCIGFDGKIYGCNRFCTMPYPIPIGYVDKKKIKITNQALCDEVAKQYELWPDECKKCEYGQQCPSCSAIPYEQDGSEAFFARKPQCGFTHAMVAARLYFRQKLIKREETK